MPCKDLVDHSLSKADPFSGQLLPVDDEFSNLLWVGMLKLDINQLALELLWHLTEIHSKEYTQN